MLQTNLSSIAISIYKGKKREIIMQGKEILLSFSFWVKSHTRMCSWSALLGGFGGLEKGQIFVVCRKLLKLSLHGFGGPTGCPWA